MMRRISIITACLISIAGCVDADDPRDSTDQDGTTDPLVEPEGPCAHLYDPETDHQVLVRIVYDQGYNDPPNRDNYEGRLFQRNPDELKQTVNVDEKGCYRLTPDSTGTHVASAYYYDEHSDQEWTASGPDFSFNGGLYEHPDQPIRVNIG